MRPVSGAAASGVESSATTPIKTSVAPSVTRAEPLVCGKTPSSIDTTRKSRRERPSSRRSSAAPSSV
eukprot:scaffold11839_cov124-Isochrysis_galbana.AAC.2